MSQADIAELNRQYGAFGLVVVASVDSYSIYKGGVPVEVGLQSIRAVTIALARLSQL